MSTLLSSISSWLSTLVRVGTPGPVEPAGMAQYGRAVTVPNTIFHTPGNGSAHPEPPSAAFTHAARVMETIGQPSLHRYTYIRPHWEALYSTIKARLEDAHTKGIVLLGTPGIGNNYYTTPHSAETVETFTWPWPLKRK